MLENVTAQVSRTKMFGVSGNSGGIAPRPLAFDGGSTEGELIQYMKLLVQELKGQKRESSENTYRVLKKVYGLVIGGLVCDKSLSAHLCQLGRLQRGYAGKQMAESRQMLEKMLHIVKLELFALLLAPITSFTPRVRILSGALLREVCIDGNVPQFFCEAFVQGCGSSSASGQDTGEKLFLDGTDAMQRNQGSLVINDTTVRGMEYFVHLVLGELTGSEYLGAANVENLVCWFLGMNVFGKSNIFFSTLSPSGNGLPCSPFRESNPTTFNLLSAGQMPPYPGSCCAARLFWSEMRKDEWKRYVRKVETVSRILQRAVREADLVKRGMEIAQDGNGGGSNTLLPMSSADDVEVGTSAQQYSEINNDNTSQRFNYGYCAESSSVSESLSQSHSDLGKSFNFAGGRDSALSVRRTRGDVGETNVHHGASGNMRRSYNMRNVEGILKREIAQWRRVSEFGSGSSVDGDEGSAFDAAQQSSLLTGVPLRGCSAFAASNTTPVAPADGISGTDAFRNVTQDSWNAVNLRILSLQLLLGHVVNGGEVDYYTFVMPCEAFYAYLLTSASVVTKKPKKKRSVFSKVWGKADEYRPVLELDRTPSGADDYFTPLNHAFEYDEDQLLSIHVFSIIYAWLYHLYYIRRSGQTPLEDRHNALGGSVLSSLAISARGLQTANAQGINGNAGGSSNDSANANVDASSLRTWVEFHQKAELSNVASSVRLDPSFRSTIISVCNRVLAQGERQVLFRECIEFIDCTNIEWQEGMAQGVGVEAVRILDLLCVMDRTLVSCIFPIIKKVYERTCQNVVGAKGGPSGTVDSAGDLSGGGSGLIGGTARGIGEVSKGGVNRGMVFCAVLQFFLNHSHHVIFDVEPVLHHFFTYVSPFSVCPYSGEVRGPFSGVDVESEGAHPWGWEINSLPHRTQYLLALSAILLLLENREKLLRHTNVFARFYPVILKLVVCHPRVLADEVLQLLPSIITPASMCGVFHSLVDLPLVAAFIDDGFLANFRPKDFVTFATSREGGEHTIPEECDHKASANVNHPEHNSGVDTFHALNSPHPIHHDESPHRPKAQFGLEDTNFLRNSLLLSDLRCHLLRDDANSVGTIWEKPDCKPLQAFVDPLWTRVRITPRITSVCKVVPKFLRLFFEVVLLNAPEECVMQLVPLLLARHSKGLCGVDFYLEEIHTLVIDGLHRIFRRFPIFITRLQKEIFNAILARSTLFNWKYGEPRGALVLELCHAVGEVGLDVVGVFEALELLILDGCRRLERVLFMPRRGGPLRVQGKGNGKSVGKNIQKDGGNVAAMHDSSTDVIMRSISDGDEGLDHSGLLKVSNKSADFWLDDDVVHRLELYGHTYMSQLRSLKKVSRSLCVVVVSSSARPWTGRARAEKEMQRWELLKSIMSRNFALFSLIFDKCAAK